MKVYTLPSSPIQIDSFHYEDWKHISKIYQERYTTVDTYFHTQFEQTGALKRYSKKGMSPKELEKRQKYIDMEIQCHKILDGCERIVPLWFYYETESEWGLMTKYMVHQTLHTYVYKYHSEYCILSEIIYPLLKTLVDIHASNIIHRDLKPENLFLHKRKLYVGDFGYSYFLQDTSSATGLVGTLQYMAPELLYAFLEKENHLTYGYEVDIWSLGIIVYELFYHRKPFGWSGYRNICATNPNNPEFILRCLQQELVFPHPIPKEAKDFIRKCLCNDSSIRPTAKELLQHPWIVNHLKEKRESYERCPLELTLIPTQKEVLAAKVPAKKPPKKLPWKTQCTIS